jgi:hypothetical protein
MRVLVFISLFGALLFGCQPKPAATVAASDGVFDFTPKRSATCEVHRVMMSPKLVDLDYGMKPVTDLMKARWERFPHADEMYDTGYCASLGVSGGRVFVCDQCTHP